SGSTATADQRSAHAARAGHPPHSKDRRGEMAFNRDAVPDPSPIATGFAREGVLRVGESSGPRPDRSEGPLDAALPRVVDVERVAETRPCRCRWHTSVAQ